jgi:superfamily II DNA or RNA helicase
MTKKYGKNMCDIKVYLKDYSMLYVDCEPGIGAELSDYFSFYVPGYKFMPAYKNKVWDGKIRLFNRMTGELNAGLFVYLLKYAKSRSYKLEQVKTEYGYPIVNEQIDTEDFNEFLYELNLPFMPYEYQYNSIIRGINQNRAILLSPTGSGKSFIIYLLSQYYLRRIKEHNEKVLIVVPTTSLVEQLSSDFINDYKMNDYDEKVHKIYSGKDKNTDKDIVISTWQSIYKLGPKWFKQFGMVIGDECHGFKSKSLSSIMNKSNEAKYRFGLTGTLDGTQTHQLVLEGLFGPVYEVTRTKDLQEEGTLAPLDIKIPVLQYSKELKDELKGSTYQNEIDFLCKNDKRNNFIANLAESMNGNTLVLYNFVEKHGKPLYDLINSKVKEGRKVFFVSGDVNVDDRETIRKIVEKQKDAIVVASLGTFSTGINIKNLHNIIFASPSKSQIKVLQSIGRGLRQSENGATTVLYDIVDDLSMGKHKNFALKHSVERIKIYEKQEFKYKMIKVDLYE